ncbi:MAG: class I SAM-dependent methyltransferase, partial [Nodosilinea sp.]
ELEGCQDISMYQCSQTNLRFFVPQNISGSGKFYEQLSEFSWYYASEKWEYDVAISDLADCERVLEVGCGEGYFIKRLIAQYSLDAIGTELNPNAVRSAQEKGVPVFRLTLQEMLKDKAQYFDAACSFQVLEHVSDPLGFLEDMTQLIRPSGKLIVSVPNAQSFTKHAQDNLLDWPPHHMHQWCEKTFKSLTDLLPVELVRIKAEPLAAYHVDWYLGIQIARLPENSILRRVARGFAHHLVGPILRNTAFLRKLITGHTLYVEFSINRESKP